MQKKIVMGVIPAASAETAVNNLVEAEYAEKDISLIMQDEKTARNIIADKGPLSKTSPDTLNKSLAKLHVDPHIIQSYQDALKNNAALLAVRCDADNVGPTNDMLSDYKPTNVTVI